MPRKLGCRLRPRAPPSKRNSVAEMTTRFQWRTLDSSQPARKEEAIAFGRRAAELRPIEKDAVDGATVLTTLAMIYAWSDEPNLAIDQLTTLSTVPGGPDYGQLRYDPAWDSLRGDNRFARILETAQHFHR